MPKPFIQAVRLLISLAALALPLAASPTPANPGDAPAGGAYQQIKSVLPREYTGTFEFTDARGRRHFGHVTLKVREDNTARIQFTNRSLAFEGEFITLITRQGIPGGHVHFKDDRHIDIKWVQCDTDPTRLKIVGSNARRYVFRFCSDKINEEDKQAKTKPDKLQCSTKIRPPC